MKCALVGTLFGEVFLVLRVRLDLLRNAMARNPEQTGMLVKDSRGLTEEAILGAYVYPRRTQNIFVVTRHRRAEIRDRAREIPGIPIGEI